MSYDQLGENPQPNRDQHNVLEIQNNNHLSEVLNKYRVVCVDIYADWCGPCKMTAPAYASLAERYTKQGEVILVKYRFENIELAERKTITGIPLFDFYVEGRKVDKVVGGNIDEVEDKLKNIISKVNTQLVQDLSRVNQGSQFTRNSIRNNRNNIPDTTGNGYQPPAPGRGAIPMNAQQYHQYQ